jgi:putative ABC transport system permease protein
MFRDFRLGIRTAFRSPGYSVVAIITMALAIGANTLLFSIANPLVVRPLPLGDPDSVGWIRQVNGPRGVTIGRTSMPDFLDFRAQATSFTTLAAREMGAGTLVGHGDPRRVTLARVTTNLPAVWGLSSAMGRLFLEGEDAVGRAPVGVISHRFWREYFNNDPAVLNRTMTLDGQTLTIVGVMESKIEFGGLIEIDVWVPLPLDPSRSRDDRQLSVMGTLARGATVASAGVEMKALAARLAAEYPATNTDWDLNVLNTRSAITGGDTWTILGLMSVVVGFVLLIACASLGNLARARLVGRKQDLAVRKALGASRLQLVRPLVSESLMLGLAGGAAGLLFAHAGLTLINAIAFEPFFKTLAIDQYVLIFNLGLSVITPLLFSVWPALSQSRPADSESLRGTRIRGSRSGRRRGGVLIASQVAMALSLLVVSALAVQSMWHLRNTPLGLDVDQVLTFKVDLPVDRYPSASERGDFARRLAEALEQIPGATAAATATHLPVFDAEVTRGFTGTNNDGAREGEEPWASWYAVSPKFFETTGIPVLVGRGIEATDTADRQPVAVLGQLAATRYFTDPAAAIGRTINLSGGRDAVQRVTIVGVVADTRNAALVGVSPQMYVPLDQAPAATLTAVLASPAPDARISDVRSAVRRLDSALAITVPKPLTQIVDEEMSSTRIINVIFVAFAALALVLAAAGLYGVISFTVGQRRQEFGVRLALGAEPGSIRTMVLREGLRMSTIGVVIGLGLAWLLALASASALYGISPNDPLTYVGVTVTVIVVAIGAVWIPATRAMGVDPLTALRAE